MHVSDIISVLKPVTLQVFSGKEVKVDSTPREVEGQEADLTPYDPGAMPPSDRQLIKHLTI